MERLACCIPHKDKLNWCANTTYSNYSKSLPPFIYPLSEQEDWILWLFASHKKKNDVSVSISDISVKIGKLKEKNVISRK